MTQGIIMRCVDVQYLDCNGQPARFLVEHFRRQGFHVVVLIEPENNPGMTVCNAIERVIPEALATLGLTMGHNSPPIYWIETTQAFPAGGRRFELITFRLCAPAGVIAPQWRIMTDDDWAEIAMKPAPPGEHPATALAIIDESPGGPL